MKTSKIVSVAGFLGYDVLELRRLSRDRARRVSVAGFLGYDVLAKDRRVFSKSKGFQLLVF